MLLKVMWSFLRESAFEIIASAPLFDFLYIPLFCGITVWAIHPSLIWYYDIIQMCSKPDPGMELNNELDYHTI